MAGQILPVSGWERSEQNGDDPEPGSSADGCRRRSGTFHSSATHSLTKCRLVFELVPIGLSGERFMIEVIVKFPSCCSGQPGCPYLLHTQTDAHSYTHCEKKLGGL